MLFRSDERETESTRHRNERGFDVVDAPGMTRAAVYVLAGGTLRDDERSAIARRLVRYHRQLAHAGAL